MDVFLTPVRIVSPSRLGPNGDLPLYFASVQDFEFKGGGRRELKTLSVNKNKLWNLTLGCPEKAWRKQEEPFKAIVDSFLPRL